MVGHFSDSLPSQAQLASLERLVKYLTATYNIPAENIISHRDAPNANTICPGQTFCEYINAHLRTKVIQYLATVTK